MATVRFAILRRSMAASRAFTAICGFASIALAATVVTATSAASPTAARGTGTAAGATHLVAAPPVLSVTPVVSGLSIPWDVEFLPDGTMLYDQRGGGLSIRTTAGTVRNLAADFADLWASGETGLMGLAVDPGFATNRTIYSCQGWKNSGDTVHDVRVVKWTVDSGLTVATRTSVIVSGMPATSGRHGGCRLSFDPSGALMVGTGDAATGTNPQDMTSLGGKTLRVQADGAIPADNPFASSGNANTRRIFTYGHRNVQGLARRPGTGEMWAVEHGPDRDDEVNRLISGSNYGWDPIPLPYNEAVPMTDLTKFPDAVPARWTSGDPTIATSGADFLVGQRWGDWQGGLAVAALKGSKLSIMLMNPAGTITRVDTPTTLEGTYGRLRAVRMGPDDALYVSTSNGSNDEILRVAPPPVPPPGPGTYHDFTGDGRPDLVARSADGALRLHPGNGIGMNGSQVIGRGWAGFTALFSPGDWDGDGWPDIIARTPGGDLRVYFWNGSSLSSNYARVGIGWSGVSLAFSPGDFTGDGHPDVVGRTPDGVLRLWRGNGVVLAAPTVIGRGWNGMTALMSSGDFNGDGMTDVLARSSDGVLLLYAGVRTGLRGSTVIGIRWDSLSALLSPGDWNMDGQQDLVGRSANGDLRLYRWGGSSFTGQATIGIGWNGQTAVL